ncbi:MAG: hypothetical protein CMD92_06990 [Gammaproteobacteria bacterium]|nr:hypothetical protein [Gammaproteobacteria bacterium]
MLCGDKIKGPAAYKRSEICYGLGFALLRLDSEIRATAIPPHSFAHIELPCSRMPAANPDGAW